MDAKPHNGTGGRRLPAEVVGEHPHDARPAPSITGWGCSAPESAGVADLDVESAIVALQHVHSNVAGLRVNISVLNCVRARLDDRKKERSLQGLSDPSCTQPASHRNAEITELFAPRRKPSVEPDRWRRFEPHHQHREVVVARLVDAKPGG